MCTDLRYGVVFPPTVLPAGTDDEVIPGYRLRIPNNEEHDEVIMWLKSIRRPGDVSVPFDEDRRQDLWAGAECADVPGGAPGASYLAVLVKHGPSSGGVDDGWQWFDRIAALLDLKHPPRIPVVIRRGADVFMHDGRIEMPKPWEHWCPTSSDLLRFREVCDEVCSLDQRHVRIQTALELFWSVYRRDFPSGFDIVALMSVIECLVTHRTTGKGDGISSQIRAKVPRVLGRFCAMQTSHRDSEQLWRYLYRVRSQIAHGEKPEFGPPTKT